MVRNKPRVRSLYALLQVLDCEGFTPYARNQIRRWYTLHRKEEARELKAYQECRAKFRLLMRERNKDERKTIGRFISMECAQSAHAVLKILLAVGVTNMLAGEEEGIDSTPEEKTTEE